MSQILTIQNITFAICIISILFSIFLYFRTPQEALDKRQSILERETENKAEALRQQRQWEEKENERRFNEMAKSLDASRLLAENHIHSIDVKVENLTANVNLLSNRITELSTIINERIPRK